MPRSDKPHFKRVYLYIGGFWAWGVYRSRSSIRPVIICRDLVRAQDVARRKFHPNT